MKVVLLLVALAAGALGLVRLLRQVPGPEWRAIGVAALVTLGSVLSGALPPEPPP